jgi:hypothetical protein
MADAFPYDFKNAYAEEMLQVTEDAVEHIWRRHGPLGVLRLPGDVAIRVAVEHVALLWRDIRYGMRILARSPGFTAVALISLTLRIPEPYDRAQDRFAQSVCENILKSANYNQYHSVSTIDQGAVTKANLCIADYSSATHEQQARISASYGLFSGNAGGSARDITTTQHNECGGHYPKSHSYSLRRLADNAVARDSLARQPAGARSPSTRIAALPTTLAEVPALGLSADESRYIRSSL